MKIYTKTGDDGTTGLVGGQRVEKSDPRIECYGTVDELNSVIGLAAVGADAAMLPMLRQVQHELFAIGSHLATANPSELPPAIRKSLPELGASMSERLEREMDAAEAELAPLQQFILPGGTELSARLHVARTICRRAERLAVAIATTPPVIVTYLNRLSDWLFVQARVANRRGGVEDVPWRKA